MLSEVPEGWIGKALGDVCAINMGQSPKSSDVNDEQLGMPFLQGCAEFGDYVPTPKAWITKPLKVAEEGDILFSVRAPVGKMNIAPVQLCIGRGLCAINSESAEQSFLKYLLAYITPKISSQSQGSTFQAVNKKQIHEAPVLLPPRNEQHRVAEILSSVDASIQATQAVIEQAERVKRGLMEELLTGGLGSEAIERGEVPEGWKKTVVGEACQKVSVGIASSTTHAYTDSGVPLLRNQNIKYGFIDDTEVLEITREFDEQNASKRLRAGDVISMRTGYTGASALVDERFDGCQSFTTLISRPKSELLRSMYLVHWMNSPLGRRLVKRLEVGGAQANLNAGTLKKFPLLLPSLSLQEEIVERIDSLTKIIVDNERTLVQQALTKKGLMNDLLTGKVRTV